MAKQKKKRISKQRTTIFVLFGVYTLIMMYLLFFQRIGIDFSGLTYGEYISSSINLIPFETITNYAKCVRDSSEILSFAFINLSGNIIMFIPLGFFMPMIWKKQRKFSKFIVTVCIIIIAVETIQLLAMLGSCDIDDLLFNIIGATIGFGIWKLKPVLKLLYKYGFI